MLPKRDTHGFFSQFSVIAQKGRNPDSDSEEIRRKRCAQILEQVFGPPEYYNEITVVDALRNKALAEAQVNLAVCARDIEMIQAFVRKREKQVELEKEKEEREILGAVVPYSHSARPGNAQSTAIIEENGENNTLFRKSSCTDEFGIHFHDKTEKNIEQNTVIVKPATTNEGLILQATTASKEHEEEMLTQKLEDIREVPVVEAEPKFDIQNPPKTQGPPTLNTTVINELSRTKNCDANDQMDELAIKYLQDLMEIQRQIIKDMELLGIPCDKSATKYKGVLFKTVLERNLGAPSVDIDLQKKTNANSETKVFTDNKPVSMEAAKARIESAFVENPKTMSFDLQDWKYCNDSFRYHYKEYTKRFCTDLSQSPSCRILQEDNLHAYNCQNTQIGLKRVFENSAVLSQPANFLRAQGFSEGQTIDPLRSIQIFIDESLSRLNLNNETAAESLRRMREQDRIIYCREIGRQLAKNLAVFNFCPPKSGSSPCKPLDPKCRPKCPPPPRNRCPSPKACIPDPEPPPKKCPRPDPCPPPICSCPPRPKVEPSTFKCPAVQPCPPAVSSTTERPQIEPVCPSKEPKKSKSKGRTCTCNLKPKVKSPSPKGQSTSTRKSPLPLKCERPATPKSTCPKCPPHPQRTDRPDAPECNPPAPKCLPPSSACPPCPPHKPKCPPSASKAPAREPSGKPWKGPKCPWTKPCGGNPFTSCVGNPRGIVLQWTPSEDSTKKSLLPELHNNYCTAGKSTGNSESNLVALHYISAFLFQDMSLLRIMGPKDYTPWTPIPSWPYPVKHKKRPLQTPKEGCKIPLPSRVRPRCLQFPCQGFPKRLAKFTKME